MSRMRSEPHAQLSHAWSVWYDNSACKWSHARSGKRDDGSGNTSESKVAKSLFLSKNTLLLKTRSTSVRTPSRRALDHSFSDELVSYSSQFVPSLGGPPPSTLHAIPASTLSSYTSRMTGADAYTSRRDDNLEPPSTSTTTRSRSVPLLSASKFSGFLLVVPTPLSDDPSPRPPPLLPWGRNAKKGYSPPDRDAKSKHVLAFVLVARSMTDRARGTVDDRPCNWRHTPAGWG